MIIVDNTYHIIKFEEERLLAIAKNVEDASYNDDVWKNLNLELLDIIQKYRPKTMLMDSTKFDFVVSPDLQTWYSQEIALKIYQAGVEKIAVVMSPNFVVNLATEQLVEEIGERKIITTFFGNYEAAQSWLDS